MTAVTARSAGRNRSSWSADYRPRPGPGSIKSRFSVSSAVRRVSPPTSSGTLVVHIPKAGMMTSARDTNDDEGDVTHSSPVTAIAGREQHVAKQQQHPQIDDDLDKYDISFSEYPDKHRQYDRESSKSNNNENVNLEYNYDRKSSQQSGCDEEAEKYYRNMENDDAGALSISQTPPSSRSSVRELTQHQQKEHYLHQQLASKESEYGHLGLEASLQVSRLDLRPHDLLELTKDLYTAKKQKNNSHHGLGILLGANRLPPLNISKDQGQGQVQSLVDVAEKPIVNLHQTDEVLDNVTTSFNWNSQHLSYLPENYDTELQNSTSKPNLTEKENLHLQRKFGSTLRLAPQFSLLHPLMANSRNRKKLEAMQSSPQPSPSQLDRVTLRQKAICALRDSRLQPIITEYLKHHADKTISTTNQCNQTTARDVNRPKQVRRQKRFKFSDVKTKKEPNTDNSNALTLAAVKLRLIDS